MSLIEENGIGTLKFFEGFNWLREAVARPSPGATSKGVRVKSAGARVKPGEAALPGVIAPWDLGQ